MRIFIAFLVALLACVSPVMADEGQEKIPVGVAWFQKSDMADRVLLGLKENLRVLGPEIELEVFKELRDEDSLKEKMAYFQRTKKAMIILRSPGATALKKFNPTIPSFIGATNDPKSLGVIEHPEAPEGNITGVSYAISIYEHFLLYRQLLPDLKSVTLFLQKGHSSTSIERQQTEEVCQKRKIDLRVIEISSVEEAIKQLKTVESDLIIVGNQNILIDNGGRMQLETNIPLVSYSDGPAQKGALASLAANDVVLGHRLAESVVQVLKEHMPIKDVPIKLDPKPQVTINIVTAERLGLELPYALLKSSTMIDTIDLGNGAH